MNANGISQQRSRYRYMWHNKIIKKNFWLMIVLDIIAIVMAYVISYLFRFEFTLTGVLWQQILSTLPLLLIIKLSIFIWCGLYSGMWRYTSISDVIKIAKAVFLSSGIVVCLILFSNRFSSFSRAVFFLDGSFTFFFLCLNRGLIRYFFQNQDLLISLFATNAKREAKRLLLIGAGRAAEKLIREVHENTSIHYDIVGLIDDDPRKHGMTIHDIPVLGPVSYLPEVIARVRVDELLIAIAAISSQDMRKLIDACRQTGKSFRVLPGLGELVTGRLTVTAIRDVDYKDLLGRAEVHLDEQEIGRYLKGKTVLVTGAGGSIGSELCRQITRFQPAKIILFDASEENLYRIQMELHHELSFRDYLPVLGKIQNRALLNSLFCEYGPSVVFHAAAYKHVPLMETNPWEAVFNNVFAVRNLIETAVFHKAERFVLISTDKAVRPTNVMGASKRITELLMLAFCRGKQTKMPNTAIRPSLPKCVNAESPALTYQSTPSTIFMAVRFGNVLGSSGSVIPVFKRQIAQGGPVTVTHPEITRYFMSIEEAAQLVLQAGSMGQGGEIFLLKMGQPVKIVDMARDLIKLMGKEPDQDIPIAFSGLRPGEKLYEELITEGEGIVPTSHEKIMVLKGDGRPYHELEPILHSLADAAKNHDAAAIKNALHEMLPEYAPDMAAVPVINFSENMRENYWEA